jgi:hypothetical protein
MEFIDIAGPGEIESYLNNGYSVINNTSLMPLRLHGFQADLYAGKWAAVMGGDNYLEKFVSKGTITVLRKNITAPIAVAAEVVDEPEAPKTKKKTKETQEEQSITIEESLETEPITEVVDENKNVEVQESAQ